MDATEAPPRPRKGRGAVGNATGRFESEVRHAFDDGWGSLDEEPLPLDTTYTRDSSRSIIARNDSPDIPFDRSINPYRGCEHGCIYCFARPTHAYLGLSPGLDFESRIFVKEDAAALLRAELSKPGYSCETIALGANTDPYQPIERKLEITRRILEVLREFRHPVGIVTKSALVARDIDILAAMARDRRPQQGEGRDVAAARHPRRQALHLPVGHAYARHGALCRDAARPLRARLPSPEAQRAPRRVGARHVAIQAAATAGRSTEPALRRSRRRSNRRRLHQPTTEVTAVPREIPV